jgi:hypothetical protein
MGNFDNFFYTKPSIKGPNTHPELGVDSIAVDKGKVGDFGVNWEPVTRPIKMVESSHKHAYPQILSFIGSNLANIWDFDAEVELWIGGEKHIITETTVVYIPGNVVHCPLYFNRIGKPIMFTNMYLTAEYKAIPVK